jgi:HD-like signal output (HDOD) protein
MDLPTLRAVVVRTLKLMQDPDSDARSAERAIARDPALSAKILRVANSAFFGHARQVSTTADAIRILGFIHVQGMIIGIGAFDAFGTERLDLGGLWRHSIATATAARWLAPRVDARADEAFTDGILHDIGKLIFAIQADLGLGRADWAGCLQRLHEAGAGIEGFARAIR